jgi:hypothetical protein
MEIQFIGEKMKQYNEVFQLDKNSWFDFETVYDMAVDHFDDDSEFIEIGSWQGASAAYLALKVKESGKKINIHCLDLWTGDPHNENEQRIVRLLPPMKQIFIDNMNQLGITTLDCNTKPSFNIKPDIFMWEDDSVATLRKTHDKDIDFIFIDGGHSEEQLTADINESKRVIKDGGWIGGHDYPTVKNTVHKLFDNVETFKTSRQNDNTYSSWLVRNL